MVHESENVVENAKELLFLLCFVADFVVITTWLKYKAVGPRRFTLRGILIATALVVFQLWLFWALLG
jgi:hypothetical protein